MFRKLTHVIVVGCFLLLTGCQSGGGNGTTSTSVAVVKLLATLAPTATPDPNRPQAQMTSAPIFVGIDPTATVLPTATAYIGVFLGETQEQLGGAVEQRPPDVTGGSSGEPLLCLTAPDALFGIAWISEDAARTNLRCPIQQSFGFNGKIQSFERGAIYWREETGEVWALAPGRLQPDGSLGIGRYWYVDDSPVFSAAFGNAPEGLQVPAGNIGGVWATVPEVRDALGYATTAEQDIGVNLQRFEGGTLFKDVTVGQVFALLVDGRAFGPYSQ